MRVITDLSIKKFTIPIIIQKNIHIKIQIRDP